MEFQSKLSAEQIKSRLEERTRPLPHFKPPWDQILCRQKHNNFKLHLVAGFTHCATFTGRLKEQTQGTLIQGRLYFNLALEIILYILTFLAVQVAFSFFFSWEVDYSQTWLCLTGLILASIYIRCVSKKQQQSLLNFIQNNLLE